MLSGIKSNTGMELRKMLKPQRLGNLSLPDMELTEDKKTCRKFGHVVLVRKPFI